MAKTNVREKLIEGIQGLPEQKVKEVVNFVNYLNLKEDEWFIEFVNKRTMLSVSDKKAGKKFTKLAELQKAFK